MLNYTREKLLEFGESKASKEPPKMFDLSGADDKRLEKIRHVLKNSDIWKFCRKYKFDFFLPRRNLIFFLVLTRFSCKKSFFFSRRWCFVQINRSSLRKFIYILSI